MQANVEQFPPYREQAHGHAAPGHHEHHEPGFWQKYIFSTDHKIIGIHCGDFIWGLGALHCMTQQQPA